MIVSPLIEAAIKRHWRWALPGSAISVKEHVLRASFHFGLSPRSMFSIG
jgi:hypothetical protein